MKTVKTIMSIFVIFAMLISLIVPAFAENRMTISITNAIVKAGEEVTLDVLLENNPGFNYLKLKIEYSPYMSIKSVKDNKLFDFMMPTPGNKESNPYAYVYAAAEDEYSSGKMFSITFEVSADAPIKDHFVAVAVEQCLNQSKETVAVDTVGSMISVIKNDTVHEHSYTSAVTAPTCTEKGYTTYTCECGDTYKDNYVDATGHTIDVIPGKAATETETGLTDGEKCSVCGVITKEQTEIPATGHEHSYTSSVTAPTCTEKGYTTYTCKCGDSYKDNYVDATGSHADVDKNYKCDYCDADLPRLPVTGGDDYNDDYSLGDVNDDGKITAADARTILRASARLETLTEIQSLAADIDGNGKLAASDARIALRISARLDSIDNYIKDEPPVDEPPVDEPPVDESPLGEKIDISECIGMDINSFTAAYPEFEFEDNEAFYNGVSVVHNGEYIDFITIHSVPTEFSLFGVSSDTSFDDAVAVFESKGFVFEDESKAFNYDMEISLFVTTDEEMITITVLYLGSETDAFDSDLAMNLGCDIGLYLDNIPDLVEDEEDSSHFFTDYLDIFTDNGLVFDIIINGQCDYSIYGVAYGSTYEEAEENLAFYGFVYDEETDCWYNELYNEYVFVYYDENSLVDVVDVLVYSEQYPENELVQYLWCDIDDIENDFGELEFYPETEEYYAHYYIDGIYFYVDEFNIVTTIDIEDNEEYCILDIYTGSDLYYVTEMFALNEVYYACYDETFVIADDYLNGYTVFVSFDEGIVDYVSVYGSYYNLADYHMTEIESLLTVMPYLEKTDNLYQIPEFSFEVNEDGYVNAIILDSYNCCDINGIFVGMNGDDVSDVLEEYNFTYNFTDKDGYDFYYNTEEGLDMYVLVDESNEVVCVCLY